MTLTILRSSVKSLVGGFPQAEQDLLRACRDAAQILSLEILEASAWVHWELNSVIINVHNLIYIYIYIYILCVHMCIQKRSIFCTYKTYIWLYKHRRPNFPLVGWLVTTSRGACLAH